MSLFSKETDEEKERRIQKAKAESELYKERNLEDLIYQERREDELDRLRDVLEQKTTWRRVMIFCGILNLILILLAISGVIWP